MHQYPDVSSLLNRQCSKQGHFVILRVSPGLLSLEISVYSIHICNIHVIFMYYLFFTNQDYFYRPRRLQCIMSKVTSLPNRQCPEQGHVFPIFGSYVPGILISTCNIHEYSIQTRTYWSLEITVHHVKSNQSAEQAVS